MRLVGVYTDKRKLARDIRKLLKQKDIGLADGSQMPNDFSDYEALNNAMNYLFIKKVGPNELL